MGPDEKLLQVRQVVVAVHVQPVGTSHPEGKPRPIHDGGMVKLVGEDVDVASVTQGGDDSHVGSKAYSHTMAPRY